MVTIRRKKRKDISLWSAAAFSNFLDLLSQPVSGKFHQKKPQGQYKTFLTLPFTGITSHHVLARHLWKGHNCELAHILKLTKEILWKIMLNSGVITYRLSDSQAWICIIQQRADYHCEHPVFTKEIRQWGSKSLMLL